MALSYDIIDKNVVGKFRQHVVSCTADAASGIVDTGLAMIVAFNITPISMATASPVCKKNIGSGATSRPGILNLNGIANGDVFYVIAYGR